MNHRHTNKKIKELKQEIKRLKQSLDISIDLYEVLQQNNNKLGRERNNYRRIIKYHTMLMLLMNLIINNDSGDTDIDRILKRNIQEYYRSMNNDLMQIPTDDEEEREFDDG